jgi:hypothetical protein
MLIRMVQQATLDQQLVRDTVARVLTEVLVVPELVAEAAMEDFLLAVAAAMIMATAVASFPGIPEAAVVAHTLRKPLR